MNEKFYSLQEEKQQSIINASMEVFAKNEYKRASTDLIAAKAGISKGLLFYYFHNKKELYMYIYNYLAEVMQAQIIDAKFLELTDFFEILEYSAWNKVKALRKNPFIMDFAMRAFYSDKEAVSVEVKWMNSNLEESLYEIYFSNIDLYKFKEGVEPYRIYKMMRWMADGYSHGIQISGRTFVLDELEKEFNSWIDMMRRLVYKEEYQNERN